MNLQEMLSTPEAKKMYRELAKEFHPDKGGGSSTMKKVNAAKDDGDAALIKVYNKLKNRSIKKPPFSGKGYSDIKDKKPFPGTMDMFFKISTWTVEVEERLNDVSTDIKFILIARKSGKEINIGVNIQGDINVSFMIFNAQKHAKNSEEFGKWLVSAIMDKVIEIRKKS